MTTAAPLPAADVADLHRLVADAQEHQVDVEPFLALHRPEAIIVNIAGRRVLGRDALGEAMAAALAGPLAQVRTTVEVDDVRLAAPDVALVSCTKHVSDERPGAPPDALPTTGRLTYVAVRADGAWRIALAQTTPVA